jgi:hypothetical protein
MAEGHVLLANVTASTVGQALHVKIECALLIVEPMVTVLYRLEDNIVNVNLVTVVNRARNLFAISIVIMANVCSMLILLQKHVFVVMDTLDPLVTFQISHHVILMVVVHLHVTTAVNVT